MKKLILILLVATLITGITLSSCAAPTPAPTPTPSPSPAPAPSPSPKEPKILKMAWSFPPKGAITPGWYWFGEELEKRTNGAYKIDFYGGGALYKSAQVVDALKSGISDLGFINPMSFQNQFPLSTVAQIPSTSHPDKIEGYMASYETALEMFKKYPEMRDEWKDFEFFLWHPMPSNHPLTNKKITKPDELKGMKLQAESYDGDIVKEIGATAVHVVPPELYLSMERNVVQGAVSVGWNHVDALKLYEVGKYMIDNVDFMHGVSTIMINRNSWNSLPPDIQKLMKDMAPEIVRRSSIAFLESNDRGKANIRDRGGDAVVVTPAEQKLWQTYLSKVDGLWLEEMKSLGVTKAPQVLEDFKKILASKL